MPPKKKYLRAGKSKKIQSLLRHVNHEVLAVIGLVILLSAIFTVYTLAPDTGGFTGWASATQTIAFLKAGKELFFEVKVDGVKDLTLTFNDDARDVILVVEEVDAVSWDFKGTVYSRFKVSSADAAQVEKARFTLKVKPEELDRLGISLTELKLYQEKREIPLTFIKKEDGFIYYKAEAFGIGEFVMGKAQAAATPESVVSAPAAEKVALEALPVPAETAKPVQEKKELPLAGKATAVGEEEKGFFGRIGDFFKGLFE